MTCDLCGKPLPPARAKLKRARFCSRECAAEWDRRRYIARPDLGISTATAGMVSELRASVDLALHGYEVYRALSLGSPADLVAIRNDVVLRIQVRTAYRTANGSLIYSKKLKDGGRHDHYAAVIHAEGVVVYEPPLPEK